MQKRVKSCKCGCGCANQVGISRYDYYSTQNPIVSKDTIRLDNVVVNDEYDVQGTIDFSFFGDEDADRFDIDKFFSDIAVIVLNPVTNEDVKVNKCLSTSKYIVAIVKLPKGKVYEVVVEIDRLTHTKKDNLPAVYGKSYDIDREYEVDEDGSIICHDDDDEEEAPAAPAENTEVQEAEVVESDDAIAERIREREEMKKLDKDGKRGKLLKSFDDMLAIFDDCFSNGPFDFGDGLFKTVLQDKPFTNASMDIRSEPKGGYVVTSTIDGVTDVQHYDAKGNPVAVTDK